MFLYALLFSAAIAFPLSLCLAYWLTKRSYTKRRKWTITAPLFALAAAVVSSSPAWGQFIYDFLTTDHPNCPINPVWYIHGLAFFIFFVFPPVFLIQVIFSSMIYTRLKKQSYDPMTE